VVFLYEPRVLCYGFSVKTIGEDTRFVGKQREMKDNNLLLRTGENPESMVAEARCKLFGVNEEKLCWTMRD
jgi:hypothetical protein